MLKIFYNKQGKAFKYYPVTHISKDEIERLSDEIYLDKLKEYMADVKNIS